MKTRSPEKDGKSGGQTESTANSTMCSDGPGARLIPEEHKYDTISCHLAVHLGKNDHNNYGN